MIFCEAGASSAAALDDLAVFVSQARAHGLPVVVARDSLPEGMKVAHQFDLSPFLTAAQPCSEDRLLVLGAEALEAEALSRLRRMGGQTALPCLAFGRFGTRQARIAAAGRLAYALGREPELVELDETAGLPAASLPIFSAPLKPVARAIPRIGLFFADIDRPEVVRAIRQCALAADLDLELVTNGQSKKAWIERNGYEVPAWHMGEVLPRALAGRFDLCVLAGKQMSWARFQMTFANMAGAGLPLIDATMERQWCDALPEVIAGPADLPMLYGWLRAEVLPARAAIREEMLASPLVRQFQLPESLTPLCPPQHRRAKRRATDPKDRVVFLPTNGVGLGHAKRCSLVADALREEVASSFAAFPSCTGMLTASGFAVTPLVGRTKMRPAHANDLLNHTRLSQTLKGAKSLVFDGGYVFDGVMRAAADEGVPSIWIRRGLWQEGQNNMVALDRQKLFSRIIVPQEAFEELNAPPSRAPHIVEVGPIVQRVELAQTRKEEARRALLTSLGLEDRTLVVTMLGGGVAADRRMQINAICGHLSQREDVSHLVVVWPTAIADPTWFSHHNTRVVQSIHASVLIPMADLFISAVGYNSFHEAVYGGVPSIFIPQMASYMDDQRARAVAAADRDLAVLVEPWEVLRLTRVVDDCLDGQGADLRERLRGVNLPACGTDAAARQILEVIR